MRCSVAIPFLAILVFIRIATAENTSFPFSSPEHERRFGELAQELRCLVCQNQSLADSQAGLADDLRREVFSLIEKGESDENIIQFLVNRYGEFVLYRPRVNPTTYLLWYGPAVLLMIGGLGLAYLVRRRSRQTEPTPSDDELERVRRLLDQDLDKP